MMSTPTQPWLGSPKKETLLILAPMLVPVGLVFAFQDYFTTHEVTDWWWVVLVLCIDVSHVYSTLFRLYWDRDTFRQYRSLLVIIPAVAYAVGVLIHQYDSHLFWRLLAYVAAYHFVRQQYGFMRLYARQERQPVGRWIDAFAIYNATLFPLLYWHIHYTNQLSWFVARDFVALPWAQLDPWLYSIYMLILIAYVGKELYILMRDRFFNLPKNLLVLGTYASWYVGIVWFQGDLIFTLLNVVAHGIPYMGLIWLHGEKKTPHAFNFSWRGVLIFAGVLLMLAYAEESLWDIFVWQDHPHVFPIPAPAPLPALVLSLLVPLLVLPQVTHYVLDGFIWRFSKDRQARLG